MPGIRTAVGDPVGNEVPEAQKYGELETLNQLRDLCHRLDPNRPVTVGTNLISRANASGFAELIDEVGYNEGGGSCFEDAADHLRYQQVIVRPPRANPWHSTAVPSLRCRCPASPALHPCAWR